MSAVDIPRSQPTKAHTIRGALLKAPSLYPPAAAPRQQRFPRDSTYAPIF